MHTSHSQDDSQLHRGLQNRHIQLIGLGGAIGTGLFLGVNSVLKLTGPSVILGYALVGFIAFLMMRQLGEMIVHEPVAGSFSHFANKYWGPFAGFFTGWNYWVLFILVGMMELTAVGKLMQFWYPDLPAWMTAAVCFVVITGVNLINVKLFGEVEFWFALIKVLAVVAMIGFGGYLLISGNGGPQASVSNLWSDGGFFSGGADGFLKSLVFITLAFGGIELIGVTAAEAHNPAKTLPKAINQVVYRVLIFYVGALFVLLSLMPWNDLLRNASTGNLEQSPFVMVFANLSHIIGNTGFNLITLLANVLNVVIITAVLSVYNSGTYSNGRMLLSLANQGNAPQWSKKVAPNGVPINAAFLTAAVTAIGVLLNYLMPGNVLELLFALVAAALLLNWLMISITHLKFKKAVPGKTGYTALLHPLSNYLCIGFMALVMGMIAFIESIQAAAWCIPVWIGFMWAFYMVNQQLKPKKA